MLKYLECFGQFDYAFAASMKLTAAGGRLLKWNNWSGGSRQQAHRCLDNYYILWHRRRHYQNNQTSSSPHWWPFAKSNWRRQNGKQIWAILSVEMYKTNRRRLNYNEENVIYYVETMTCGYCGRASFSGLRTSQPTCSSGQTKRNKGSNARWNFTSRTHSHAHSFVCFINIYWRKRFSL